MAYGLIKIGQYWLRYWKFDRNLFFNSRKCIKNAVCKIFAILFRAQFDNWPGFKHVSMVNTCFTEKWGSSSIRQDQVQTQGYNRTGSCDNNPSLNGFDPETVMVIQVIIISLIMTNWMVKVKDEAWSRDLYSALAALPDGTKPLPEPMLTYHQEGPVAFIWVQFYKRCLSHQSLKQAWELLI